MKLIHAPIVLATLFATTLITSSAPGQRRMTPDPELIPREVFFGNPQRASVQISPLGTHISYLAPANGVLNVWIQEIGETERKVITSATRPIRTYFWARNGEQIIYLQDRDGNENHQLFAIDVESGEEIKLTPFENIQARVTATDPKFPDEILVSINNRDPSMHDIWRINTRSGEGELIFENNEGYLSIMPDRQFNVRLATRFTSDGGLKVLTRDHAEGEWYELISWASEDTQTSGPLGFSEDGATIYLMDSRGADTGGLFAYTVDDQGEATYQQLIRDQRADLSEVILDPFTGAPQAVAFEYARREWHILDESIAQDWETLSRLSEGEMTLTSRSLDDTLWTVAFLTDDGPTTYYLYDRSSMQAQYLFSNRSELEDLDLAKMKSVTIPTRDGLELVSYLTLPRSGPSSRLPMVLLVHGGPWARDSWGYNSIHQWLANRGYAVLSVNFRGSTGFGKAFVNAGDRQWAATMHDDLIDAVNWAVGKQIADPDRIAIMGGSYGGYATLVGLTFTPDVFAAGVDIVGPSDIKTLLESIPPYWEPIRALFDKRVGSLSDPEYLASISPLSHVDAISRPLLIGQGSNDPRVKEAQSQQIVEAMRAKNLPVTYVVFPDEGHGFAHPANNLAFFAITEVFLAEHLGGRYQPIASSVRESSADVQAGAGLIRGLSESLDR